MDTQNHGVEITFEKTLREACGVREGMRVLAAVSGGADSVAMLRLLCGVQKSVGIEVVAAHFDHQLRGEASSEDARFVRRLCGQLGVSLREGAGDVRELAKTRKKGLEEAARSARYAFLYAQAQDVCADVIALAHHRDDQAETLLLHAVRGCDVRGLGGMRYRSGRLIRPLLGMEKAQLEAWLFQIKQDFRIDASNFSTDMERNRIRLQVMPTLRSVNPGVSAAFSRLALCAQRDEDYFASQIDRIALAPFVPMPYGGFFETKPIENLPDALLSRVLLRYAQQSDMPSVSALDIEKAMQMVRLSAGRTQLTGGICLVRAKARLHWIQNADEMQRQAIPLALDGVTQSGAWRVLARKALPGERGDGIRTQVLDAQRLRGAVLRGSENGDVFSPIGLSGTQKIKKTFADAGIEQPLRPYVPLIAKGERVLWMVGVKAAQDAAITAQTKEAVHLTFYGDLPFLKEENTTIMEESHHDGMGTV